MSKTEVFMTRGGNGSHWSGCHEVHWDCCINHLRTALAASEAENKRLREALQLCEPVTDGETHAAVVAALASKGAANG